MSSRGPPTRDRAGKQRLSRSEHAARDRTFFSWTYPGRDTEVTAIDLPKAIKGILPRLLKIVRTLFPSHQISEERVSLLLNAAVRAADDDYGEEEALRWANGYRFPAGIGDRDLAALQSHDGNLATYVSDLHVAMALTGRLSEDSIKASVPTSDPDYRTLMNLVAGIPIVTDPTFVPNESPPPLRAKYIRMAPCVDKLMSELYAKGLILILPTTAATQIPGIHFSQSHWARKKGKHYGRPIGDASATDHGQIPLNSGNVKAQVDQLWGPIEHPTLSQLSQMVLDQAAASSWEDVVLWKMDLKGAFMLLFVHPASVCRLAFALDTDAAGEELTMLYHVGMFGWTGMPSAFYVISRVLQRLINAKISGSSLIYVDDIMGCCTAATLEQTLAQVRAVVVALLGPDAVEDRKTEFGRRLDFIGWEFNLDLRSVSIARHNFMKTLYGYVVCDETAPQSVRQIQRLASWSSRYSAVIRALKPFTADLFSAIRGRRNTSTKISLSPTAQWAVWLWRASLLQLGNDPVSQARPIHTMVRRPPTFLVEYDASLTGIGLVISYYDPVTEWTVFQVAKLELPFDLGDDSGFQNSVEFMAVVIGLAILASLGYASHSIIVKGDNTSSLAWSTTERFRPGPSRGCAVFFMAFATIADLVVDQGIHIPGERNIVCDGLSRDKHAREFGYDDELVFDLSMHPAVSTVLEACNPLLTADTEALFMQRWRLANSVAAGVTAVTSRA